MALTTRLKHLADRLLAPVGLRLVTRTVERRERERLEGLALSGHFDQAVFPLPDAIATSQPAEVFKALDTYHEGLAALSSPATNTVGFELDNEYFSTPDAQILYALIRRFAPRRVLEVGSGNSTRITRQAILDGDLRTELWSVDPAPRSAVRDLADRWIESRVELLDPAETAAWLAPGDLLFIDSSHRLTTGNDVAWLFCQLLPRLAPGVLVHVHDVFLPWDYPAAWAVEGRWDWNEQYLVHTLLEGGRHTVLWAAHHLARTSGEARRRFGELPRSVASSLWLRLGEP